MPFWATYRWKSGGPRVDLLRRTVTAEVAAQYVDIAYGWQLGPELGSIVAPTLVVPATHAPSAFVDRARSLAAMIPGARIAIATGEMWDVLRPFLEGEDGAAAATTAQASRGAFRTVLFTDIVGHTEMMQRLGDARGRDVLREHERITRETLKQHGGAEVKTMGDGFMASFGSVTQAMDCAIALQRAFAGDLTPNPPRPGRGHGSPSDGEGSLKLKVRIGLNAGEPIEEDGDLFGSTVILASRIAAQAGAGEILIPEPLRHLLSGKSYVYADRGETMLKGFEDAVRLYEVRWRE